MSSESDEQLIQHDGDTPPNYSGSSDLLPSYNSLIERLKDARRKSSDRGSCIKDVCAILANTVGFLFILLVLLVIPIYMLAVGSLNLHHCPAQRFIPIWLIITGAALLFQLVAAIISRINNLICRCGSSDRDRPGWNGLDRIYAFFNGILGLFLFAWFIAGSIWVYSIYVPNSANPNQPKYCDHLTYYSAFSLLTIGHASFLFFCTCSCLIAFTVGAGSE